MATSQCRTGSICPKIQGDSVSCKCGISIFCFSFKIIGRILGPRGNSLRQLEAETRCKIVIRGKGSVKDSHKEKRLKGSLSKIC